MLSYQTNLYISIGASIESMTEKSSCFDQANKKHSHMWGVNCDWTPVHCRVIYCLFIFIDEPLLGILIPDIPFQLLAFIFIDEPLLGILIPDILIPGILNRRLYAVISVGCSSPCTNSITFINDDLLFTPFFN
jgi:hypothetical protein